MSLYDDLKKSIEEMEYDKTNNRIEWVAKFKGKDDEYGDVIRIGIRSERHLIFIYLDLDIDEGDGVSNTVNDALKQIEERWGYLETFEWM